MNRCENKDLFEQTVHLINDFKEYFLSHGEPVGENPSPGNKAGGISTLEEKALGCTQKCGKSYVSGVLPYGERLQKKGLNLGCGYYSCSKWMSHGAFHHWTRNTIRHFRSDYEDFYQFYFSQKQTGMD